MALVRIDCKSEPAPGSVIPIAPTTSPVTIFGNQYCFCSSVPMCKIYGAAISEWQEIAVDNAQKPARADSSTNINE